LGWGREGKGRGAAVDMRDHTTEFLFQLYLLEIVVRNSSMMSSIHCITVSVYYVLGSRHQ
jgi:hypothetical protein